jgi:hypothetical protein
VTLCFFTTFLQGSAACGATAGKSGEKTQRHPLSLAPSARGFEDSLVRSFTPSGRSLAVRLLMREPSAR